MKLTATNLIALILFSLLACKKENTTTTTQTPQQKTKTEVLTAKSWIVKEAYDMQAGTFNKYNRGAANNTNNLDNDEMTFNTNHTGTYKDATGQSYNLTWNFTSSDSTKMSAVIHYPTPVTLNYDMVALFDNSFMATHNYINGSGQRVLASFHRIHK